MIINRELHERIVKRSRRVDDCIPYHLETEIESYFDEVNFIEYVAPYFDPEKPYITKQESNHLIAYIALHAFFTDLLNGTSLYNLEDVNIPISAVRKAIIDSASKLQSELFDYVKVAYANQCDGYMQRINEWIRTIPARVQGTTYSHGIVGDYIYGYKSVEPIRGGVYLYGNKFGTSYIKCTNYKYGYAIVAPLSEIYWSLVYPHKVALVEEDDE